VTADPAYPQGVRDLFAAPDHAGQLPPGEGPVVEAEALALDRGAWVRVAARLGDGVVVRARFLAFGGPQLIAACELATARLEGRPLAEAAAVDAAALAREVGAPPERLGALLAIEDAFRGLAAASSGSR
jgi:nitrogen fixation NifU-like protein